MDNREFDVIYLSTSKLDYGCDYIPIAELEHTNAGKVTVAWDGSDLISITYPGYARVDQALIKTLGVRGILNPPLQKAISGAEQPVTMS
jgi:hypothetical protein